MGGPLSRAIERFDVQFVRGYLASRLESEYTEREIEGLILSAHKKGGKTFDTDWSDSTWVCWIRNRLAPRFERRELTEIKFLCELHIGFLCLEETPEMLLRLHEGGKMEPSAARSKISKSLLERLEPIDRVAARVSPEFAVQE